MNKIPRFISISFLSLCACLAAGASETSSVAIPASNVPAASALTNVTQLLPTWAQNIFTSLGDDAPYITNDVVNLQLGALYNGALPKGRIGAFADISVPTSQQTAAGVALAYLDGKLLYGSVTLTLGTTTSVPLLGSVYAFVEEGPSYTFSGSELGSFSFAGFEKRIDISKHWAATIGGGVGYVTQIPGTEKAAGASLSYRW